MSLFSALTVAVGGLDAQSSAIGNISDNLANTQTTGFKGIDTTFESLVTQSSASYNDPGGVRATPKYTNSVQGSLTSSDSETALAISGSGYFVVKAATVAATGAKTFATGSFYTRAGDFSLDSTGYLVNTAGYYLAGYTVSSTGVVDTSSCEPIQLSDLLDNPVGTSHVDYAANLPSTYDIGQSSASSTIQVYDALGGEHDMTYSWTKTDTNEWLLTLTVDDGLGTGSDYIAYVPFTFNSVTNQGTIETIGNPPAAVAATYTVTDGTDTLCTFTAATPGEAGNDISIEIAAGTTTDYAVTITDGTDTELYEFDAASGAFWTTLETEVDGVSALVGCTAGAGTTDPTAGDSYDLTGGTNASADYDVVDNSASANNLAQITFDLTFAGTGTQSITASFGTYDESNGVTQFADAAVSVSEFQQDGIPRGSFQSLSIDENGYVSLNYDNGRNRIIAQIPVVQFFAEDRLQRLTGGVYAQTLASGTPRYSVAGSNGAGTIVSNALEASNVDIATEFTKLIQAQRVYSANARTITTADSMLQEVINIVR